MILKTKYGTEINTDEIGEGYGKFGEYMRKNIDKEWGMDKHREITKTKRYRVELSGTATVYAIADIEAESKKDAEEIALKEAKSYDWTILDETNDIDDIEVCDVKEKK